MSAYRDLIGLLENALGKIGAFEVLYQECDEERARSYRSQGKILETILNSINASSSMERPPMVAPIHPHAFEQEQLFAVVREVMGWTTAHLFADERTADEMVQVFNHEHVQLLKENEVSCHSASVDIESLTPSPADETGGRIVYAFVCAMHDIYRVSLHDDVTGAHEAMARFEHDYADLVEAGDTWVKCHPVPLPLDWRFPHT